MQHAAHTLADGEASGAALPRARLLRRDSVSTMQHMILNNSAAEHDQQFALWESA